MRLGIRQDCVRSSSRVSGVCQDGVREFVRRRSSVKRLSGVAKKLARRAIELQPNDGPRSRLSIGSGFRRCSRISPKFARRFAEGIGKLAGNTPGDVGRRLEDSPQEYRRLPD
ncbi:hypothetical protein B296_00011108 [Ensete ventricosum]|uniref:Uncharacterized protein n=1 Tax=Ensete ventricosum TaxID=4639 RepID=A0A426XEW8_ENSVE|nr:hypothetical protein B296_00011108 [Ensete ventricosum]